MKRHKKKKKRAKINNMNAVKDDNTDTANGSKNSIKKILSTVLITNLFSKLIFIFVPFVSSLGGIYAACRIGSYSAVCTVQFSFAVPLINVNQCVAV